MSGGSYNYLFQKDAADIITHTSDLQSMAERLAGLGYAEDAARESEEILLLIRQFEVRMQVRLARLCEVWRAVEWLDSADGDENGVEMALAEYRSGLSCHYRFAADRHSGDWIIFAGQREVFRTTLEEDAKAFLTGHTREEFEGLKAISAQ